MTIMPIKGTVGTKVRMLREISIMLIKGPVVAKVRMLRVMTNHANEGASCGQSAHVASDDQSC